MKTSVFILAIFGVAPGVCAQGTINFANTSDSLIRYRGLAVPPARFGQPIDVGQFTVELLPAK